MHNDPLCTLSGARWPVYFSHVIAGELLACAASTRKARAGRLLELRLEATGARVVKAVEVERVDDAIVSVCELTVACKDSEAVARYCWMRRYPRAAPLLARLGQLSQRMV